MRAMVWFGAAALAVGCGSGSGGNGGGGGGGTGTGDRFKEFIYVDDAGVSATGDFTGLPTGDSWDTIPWLTQTVDPANVTSVAVNALVEDFQDEFPVPEATIDLWFDDVVDGTVDATEISDVNGIVGVTATACQKMAYRVTTDPLLTPTKTTFKAHHNYPPEPDGVVDDAEFVSVSDTTYKLIPTILGLSIDVDKAIIAGTAYDILRDPAIPSSDDAGKIEGAQVIVYDEDGNIPDTLSVNYFTEEFPDRDQEWTSPDGLWVAANVPAGMLRAEMWGVVDGELKLLGATVLHSEADSINISNIFAGYGDGVKYAAACEDAPATTP